jgi:arsenate reductase
MAEGLARAIFAPHVRVQSAGSAPTSLSPHAVEVMRELGIDAGAQRSKGIDAVDVAAVDTVVTLCAEEVCPVFPGHVRRLHWPIPDPATTDASIPRAEVLQRFRRARDEIRERLERYAAETGIARRS